MRSQNILRLFFALVIFSAQSVGSMAQSTQFMVKYREAERLFARNQYADAASLYAQLLPDAELWDLTKSAQDSFYLKSLAFTASSFRRSYQPEQAAYYRQMADSVRKNMHLWDSLRHSYQEISHYLGSRKPQKALEAYQQYQKLFGKRLPKHQLTGFIESLAGEAYVHLKNMSVAQLHYENALKTLLLTYSETDQNVRALREELAVLYEKTANFSEAARQYGFLLATADMLAEAGTISQTEYRLLSLNYMNMRATALRRAGALEQAKEAYEALLVAYLQNGQTSLADQSKTIVGLANVLNQLGRYDEAMKLLVSNEKKFPDELWQSAIMLHNAKGTTFFNLGKHEEALKSYQKALDLHTINSKEVSSLERASLLSNVASAQFEVGKLRPHPALLYRQAVSIIEQTFGPRHPELVTLLYNHARVQFELFTNSADFQPAYSTESIALRAYELMKSTQTGYQESSASLLSLMARIAQKKGDITAANEFYTEAVDYQYQRLSSLLPALTQKERKIFLDHINRTFKEYYQFLGQHLYQHPELAGSLYNLQVRNKGQLLREAALMQAELNTKADPELKALWATWSDLQARASASYFLDPDRNSQTMLLHDSLRKEADRVEKQIVMLTNQRQSNNMQANWQDILSALKPGQAAIEMVRIEHTDSVQYIGLILRKDKPAVQIAPFPCGKKMEGQWLQNYRWHVANKELDHESGTHFWAPLHPYLKGITKAFIATEGVYYQISPSTLIIELSEGQSVYLDKLLDLRMVHSTRDLVKPKNTPQLAKNTQIALIGHPAFAPIEGLAAASGQALDHPEEGATICRSIKPLHESRQEIQNIEHLFKKHQQTPLVLLAEQAEEQIVRSLEKVWVLHIASHAFFDEQAAESYLRPADSHQQAMYRSGIYLKDAAVCKPTQTIYPGENDGILTASEVMSMNLSGTELVVLSACETGKGLIQEGEGVYGLRRAFRIAGANSIIMSLWKVEGTPTGELMTAFYRHWLNGTDKHQALRAAQDEMRAKYTYPYYWGGFVLVGE